MRLNYNINKNENDLPSQCPNSNFTLNFMLHKSCNASFKNKKNLYQDTDLIVYCIKCGQSFGQFKKNTIPYKFENNILNKWNDTITKT